MKSYTISPGVSICLVNLLHAREWCSFLTTMSSPSMAETVASSRQSGLASSSSIVCCFWMVFTSIRFYAATAAVMLV